MCTTEVMRRTLEIFMTFALKVLCSRLGQVACIPLGTILLQYPDSEVLGKVCKRVIFNNASAQHLTLSYVPSRINQY